jgi:hypothetical protein
MIDVEERMEPAGAVEGGIDRPWRGMLRNDSTLNDALAPHHQFEHLLQLGRGNQDAHLVVAVGNDLDLLAGRSAAQQVDDGADANRWRARGLAKGNDGRVWCDRRRARGRQRRPERDDGHDARSDDAPHTGQLG